jgi:Ca-activated chloride channel family protein
MSVQRWLQVTAAAAAAGISMAATAAAQDRPTDPMRVAVLVDTSQAMRPYVNDIRQALRRFFRDVPAGHELALVEFGDRPHVLVDFTTDRGRLDAGVGRVFARTGSGAYVLDAIVDAARTLRHAEGARSSIVVITAEGPEFSQRFHQTVLDDLRRSHATLHAFVINRPRAFRLSEGAREREFTLSKGTRLTGGERVDLLTSMSLGDRLGALAAAWQAEYRTSAATPEAVAGARLFVRGADSAQRGEAAAGR